MSGMKEILISSNLRNSFLEFAAGLNHLQMGSISPTFFLAVFKCADPKSAKRQLSHHRLFDLLGSALIKAARKMLVKSIPNQRREKK